MTVFDITWVVNQPKKKSDCACYRSHSYLVAKDKFGFSIQRNGETEEHIPYMLMELSKIDLPAIKF